MTDTVIITGGGLLNQIDLSAHPDSQMVAAHDGAQVTIYEAIEVPLTEDVDKTWLQIKEDDYTAKDYIVGGQRLF